MSPRSLLFLSAAASIAFVAACDSDSNPFDPDNPGENAIVFDDDFGAGVTFQAFGGSKTDAVSIVTSDALNGSASLKVTVPAPGDPSGSYSGGALVADVARDLTPYNILTFWAKASIPVDLDVAGFGNDNTGTSQYWTETQATSLSTTWTKYTIPIPKASRLESEAGLFFFAEGPETDAAYDIFFDDIQFSVSTSLSDPRPSIPSETVSGAVGSSFQIADLMVDFSVDGADVTVEAAPGYFYFYSANDAIATVTPAGVVTIVTEGTTTIAATLGSIAAQGALTVTAADLPPTPAPTPTYPASDVISLFSEAYDNVTVDTWSAEWDVADVLDLSLGGNAVKNYTNLLYAGIEFVSQPIDASAMGSFRMDIWTPDATDTGAFKVKLVDFGPDGGFAGGDDSEHELSFTASSTPQLVSRQWVTLDIPLWQFAGLQATEHMAQLIISGDPNTVFVDNVLFHAGGEAPPPPPSEPTTAAPAPTLPEGNVISLFSNAYTDVTVDTWLTSWSSASQSDVQIAGDDAKKYENLVFAGIEAVANPIDATSMTHVHFDMWTPDATAAPAAFKLKIVDFGADGAFDGGDDVEHEITLTDASTPPLASNTWVSYDIPLADFTGLTTQASLAQFIISGDPNTVYLDNFYFYTETPSEPTVPAPTPTLPEANVISLFSNAYTDVAVDTWLTSWSNASQSDFQVAGDDIKKYENLVFAGIETVANQIDATAMTHLHFDMWTPDATADPAAFKLKIVDFGADGAFGGGDDVEHEITLTDASTPPLASYSWVSYDIPLADFTGLTTQGHLAQFIISGDPNTVFLDNVYLYAPPAPEPAVAAPTPTVPAADVISLFSNAYTDVTVDTWLTSWSNAAQSDFQVAGDDIKKYENLVFAGIETVANPIDATAMTHFHFDLWTPDPTADPAAFKFKIVDFGADGAFGGGDDVEHEISLTDASTPPLASYSWVSYDIPLADFTGLTTQGHLAQFIISGDPNTVFLDNVFFYKVPQEPTTAAPTPTLPAADVISLFSNAYTDVPVDTWLTSWSNASQSDFQVAGDDIKKYENLVFAGIETVGNQIDATAMTHFHFDMWTPDPTASPAAFKFKIVDFGADGAFGGGDDVEHEISLTAASTPPLASNSWVSYDIPLADFTGLTTKGHLAQFIISGDPNTVFLDNVYLHK